MNALSIRQPWAWLILHGGKDIENRVWRTRYRGPVLIHASAGMTAAEYASCAEFLTGSLAAYYAPGQQLLLPTPNGPAVHFPPPEALERGGIVGEAVVSDCVTRHDSPWFFGRYGFVLANARALPFQPCRGALKFFNLRPSVSLCG